jgi:NADPH:quinone reductase-like Zn-dependent oxidoreductase
VTHQQVRKLGADHVLDYTKIRFLEGDEKYDSIFDTVGSTSFSSCKPALNEDGRLLLSAASLPQILESGWASRQGTKRVVTGNAPESVEHLRYLRELVESGRYRPLIDRSYPLERIVDAHA